MLKIRLSRSGKKKQPSYRVVVQEHTSPIKGKFIEEVGFYRPADNPKVFSVNGDRIKHWLGNGAQPSDTLATLLKREGFEGMDKFIDPKNKKAKRKKGGDEPAPAPAPSAQPAEAKPDATPEATAETPSA